MKPALTRRELYHHDDHLNNVPGPHKKLSGDTSKIYGDCCGLSGNVSGLSGNVSGLSGNVSGLSGNVSGLIGDIDECQLTAEERAAGVAVESLIVQNPPAEAA